MSGGISSVIGGGDAFQGALVGAFSAGASSWMGSNVPFLRDSGGGNFGDYLGNVTRRALIGGAVGGTTSFATGGDFWQGAAMGASTSAIAYTANEFLHPDKPRWQQVPGRRDPIYARGSPEEGYVVWDYPPDVQTEVMYDAALDVSLSAYALALGAGGLATGVTGLSVAASFVSGAAAVNSATGISSGKSSWIDVGTNAASAFSPQPISTAISAIDLLRKTIIYSGR